jgi:DNA-binding NtrC family response regulator
LEIILLMKILLIDDDVTSVKRLAFLLEAVGHCCKAFTVPKQAVEAYRRNIYDVVITDVLMPGMSGLEVLQEIRSINPDAKVIVVTGQMDTEIIIVALKNQANDLLNKPLSIEKLLAVLSRIELENRDV